MYLYTFLKKDPSIFESILECLVLIDYALFHVSFIKVVDWISYLSDFFYIRRDTGNISSLRHPTGY